MNPPVEAPISRASRPATAMPKRIERVCQLQAAASDVGMIGGDRARRPRAGRSAVPALVTTWPSTCTWAARISARARSREGARPRSTTRDDRDGALAWRIHSRMHDPAHSPTVIPTLDDPPADVHEARIAEVGRLEIRFRPVQACDGHRSCGVQPVQRRDTSACPPRHPCQWSCPSVPASAFDVEDVVDNLKRQAELGCRQVDAGDHPIVRRPP